MTALTSQSAPYPFINDIKEKVSIPVVRNVIRNQDLSKFKPKDGFKVLPRVSSKGSHLMKVLKLLTDKHSKNLTERHSRAISKLYLSYKYGIHLKDVKYISAIIEKCHEYLTFDSVYEDLLCLLVNLLGKPFLKSKVSDEESFLYEVSESLNQLGAIAEVSSDKVKVVISATLSTLYTSKEKHSLFSDCKPVSTMFIKSAVEKSNVCKSMAECLVQVSDCENRYILMKSLNHLSDTTSNCRNMLKASVVATICNNLNNDAHIYRLLFVGIETLWNILDNDYEDDISLQLGSELCLRSLHSVFLKQISQCTSYADRQLRNDILVIISLIASKYPSAPLVECGLTKTISMYSVYPELPTGNEKISKLKLTQSPEDFELKKLFLNMIQILCNNSLSVNVMSLHNVMLGLFSYVIPIKHPHLSSWTLAQFEELQLQAMAVLSQLAPLCIKDYMDFQGNARLLTMLDWCVCADEFSGHGNSFYGYGGQGNKRAQMRLCVRLLRDMCATCSDEVCQDLTDQGLIDQLVAILGSCSGSLDTNDAVDIELQCDMLFILASLCEDDVHRQTLFGEEGVKIILVYLDGYINILKGPLDHHKLLLSAIDCLCSAVIGCYMNEIEFLQREGAFLLLDLLDICPKNMQNVVLGTIADLIENDKAVPHFLLWRGKDAKRIGKALTHMWIEEERRLCVQRLTYGVIADYSRPLVTNDQEKQGICALPSSHLTPAIVDVSDNLRSKIYGIFWKIGFNNIPGLDAPDYVVLSIIEKYLDFKTLEVWQEIKKELEIENIEPVSPDREFLDEIISILQSKALTVTVIQKALIENNFEEAISDEKDFYEKIKETYKQTEKSYQDFVDFVDRTSDYAALKEAKTKQLKSIDVSRMQLKRFDDQLMKHKTMDQRLQTTTFCGRHVVVESMKTISQNKMNGESYRHKNKVISHSLKC